MAQVQRLGSGEPPMDRDEEAAASGACAGEHRVGRRGIRAGGEAKQWAAPRARRRRDLGASRDAVVGEVSRAGRGRARRGAARGGREEWGSGFEGKMGVGHEREREVGIIYVAALGNNAMPRGRIDACNPPSPRASCCSDHSWL